MLIPFFICLLIIIFPFFPFFTIQKIKEIEESIESIKNNNESIEINLVLKYIFLIVLSPFFLRQRLQTSKIKSFYRYALFCALIYPLILPIHFMAKINGKIGYSFYVFLVLDGKANYQHWSLQYTFIYYANILFSFVIFITGKKFGIRKNYIILFVNGLFFFAMFFFLWSLTLKALLKVFQ